VRDEKFAAVDVEGVGLAVRSSAFVGLEALDGSVNLGISNILKGGTWGGVVIEGIDVVVSGRREEEAIIKCLSFVLVLFDFAEGVVR